MIFLFVMPASSALMNYMLPLLIGARDVAFPRLNALSWWIFFFGGIFLYSTFIFGTSAAPIGVDGLAASMGTWPQEVGPVSTSLADSPDGGWFGYQPNAGPSTPRARRWTIGPWAPIIGLASLVSSVNFLVTVLNLRAKGMRLLRMPVFAWMTTITSFLLLFLPIIAVALFMVTFDRQFGSLFFAAQAGGDVILWQHLFWLFGHPEVYILILPAMGIVSEILPTFSRKPLFGYSAVVFAGAAIAFLGFGVWAHHMFASGITPVAASSLRSRHHDHRHPDRDQDLQLARHDVDGADPAGHTDAVRHRLCRHVHHRRLSGSPMPSFPPIGSRRIPITSWPISTT